VICFAFSLPPTAFTRQVNRNTAETAQEAALEEGLAPLMGWVKRLIDQVIQRRMGHPDLEFVWSDQKPIDPEDQAKMLVDLVGAGLNTLNEARDQLGLDPVEGGDEILFKTATGPVTLDNVLNPPEPPPMVAPGGAPGQNGGTQNGQNPPRGPGKPPASSGTQPGGKPTAGGKKKPPAGGKPGQKPEKPEGGAEAAGQRNGKGKGVGKVAGDPLRQAAGEPPQHGIARRDEDPLAAEARALLRRAGAGRSEATGEGDGARGLAEALNPPPPWRLITAIATKASGHVDPDNARPPKLPIADDVTEADVQHIAWQIIHDAIDRGEAPPTRMRTVPISDLIATQRVVDDERVADDAADYRAHGQGDEMPFVIEWRDGKFYIMAGHHHAEGALDEGATEMRVQELYPKADD
jgi:hypothetical protein